MTRFKNYLYAGCGLLIFAAAFTLVAPHEVRSQGGGAVVSFNQTDPNNRVRFDVVNNLVKLDPAGNTVQGTVKVGNSAAEAVPVSTQGTTNVAGTVGISASANTVKLDSTGNTIQGTVNVGSMPMVKLDPTGNTVQGTVGILASANTVKLDPSGNTVQGTVGLSTSANTVKLDSTGNTVQGTVGISTSANTVKLDSSNNLVQPRNTAAIPLFVINVDEPARQTFQQSVPGVIPAGSQVFRQQVAVPGDKTLVIEHVSAGASLLAPQIIAFDISAVGGTGLGVVDHTLVSNLHGTVGGVSTFKASQPIRMYVPPGGRVQLEAVRDGGTAGNADVLMSFSGYFVSTP